MFPLLRYFSLTSLASIVAAAVLLGVFYRHVATGTLIEAGERNNVVLTHALANVLRADYEPLLAPAGDAAAAVRASLHDKVVTAMRGLSIAKVKIYDARGRTVYSSDPRQIGEDKSANAGFRAALAGRTVSELSHRDTFSAFEQTLSDRDLLSSYVPVRSRDGSSVSAVFEIYDDMTSLLAHVERTARIVGAGVVVVLSALYGILFLVVRRADRILATQYAERAQHAQALAAARDMLEQRVAERTADFARANALLQDEVAVRRRAQAGLGDALAAADKASAAKSRFLGNMSHELRTPLNGILGMTDLLLSGEALEPAQRRRVESIRSSGTELGNLIEALLDASRIDSESICLAHAEFLLRDVVVAAVDRYRRRADTRGLALELAIDGDVPARATGDAARLGQLVSVLVDNAVRFTEAGRVDVRVSTADDPHANARGKKVPLRITVSDTGVGIAPEMQEAIFRPFFQVDDSAARRHGGAGLGLTLARDIVAAMEGSIDVESRSGEGTRVRCMVRLSATAAVGGSGSGSLQESGGAAVALVA
jgi:signal transduction histidine kinase